MRAFLQRQKSSRKIKKLELEMKQTVYATKERQNAASAKENAQQRNKRLENYANNSLSISTVCWFHAMFISVQ